MCLFSKIFFAVTKIKKIFFKLYFKQKVATKNFFLLYLFKIELFFGDEEKMRLTIVGEIPSPPINDVVPIHDYLKCLQVTITEWCNMIMVKERIGIVLYDLYWKNVPRGHYKSYLHLLVTVIAIVLMRAIVNIQPGITGSLCLFAEYVEVLNATSIMIKHAKKLLNIDVIST